ncbi:hypothetical protein SAMN02910353_00214 [Ruminococcus sp. YRD2003]|uniref:hypothetical protein n=1 Tax=Ruminococcus sp. YRD2003 TaxID=1452313 RepID=UPI0008C7E4E9|nr:hypothetical protein SAMN02910353_00214 [Ruminococcus flavefaciens]
MRIYEPTPNDGDYSELLYFDKYGKVVESEENAVSGVIRECRSDGTLICETWIVPKQ